MFQDRAANNLRDSWRLEFDNNIEANHLSFGWQQYIKNTSARFQCTSCRRTWPSNRVMVVFHMNLMNGQGVVKVRPFRQNCKRCTSPPMETPSITSENIAILLDVLIEKIRIKCYHEDLGQNNKHFTSFEVKSPHEPSHCEACLKGICERNTVNPVFKKKF
ncbi:hypothetical protein Q5P01_015900 [Channa striata]|uniref:3CxxC-type domain-containing protein n=1 Tax=Channa striata TaxID=64152 RepID=A0AA88MFC2_CHASR|nr:hypothetical protein Q5P01_015900 [Channa striata]